MIEAVILLAALIALGWVLLWSMIQDKVKPGAQLKGFFAMKHDLHLEEKAMEEDSGDVENKLGDGASGLDWRAGSNGYNLSRGRHRRR